MKRVWLLFWTLAALGCGETAFDARDITLDSLGQNQDFSDTEINEDFPDPEPSSPDPSPSVGDDPGSADREPSSEDLPFAFKFDTFFLEPQNFSLAHGPALRWDGCQQDYESAGGYNSDTRCGRAFFHPGFSDQLNSVFFKCSQVAAKAAGFKDPARLFINHLGSYNDRNARNSSRLSNHAYARALDISSFLLYDQQGQLTKVSTLLRDYSGAQAIFYDEFRECWRDHLSQNCAPGDIEHQGSIGHSSSQMGGNSLHNDHIHLSFPLCAG